MVDAWKITDYGRNEAQLQEFLLFAVCVAGKKADTTARALDKVLQDLDFVLAAEGTSSPFQLIRDILVYDGIEWLGEFLRQRGMGCYNQRAKSFAALVSSGLDLKSCSVHDLERLPGVGPKTARFFLLHSREGFRGAALDTHILKYLKASGVPEVPRSTPSKGTQAYGRLEQAFLALVPPWSTPAAWDLEVWTRYAKRAKPESFHRPVAA